MEIVEINLLPIELRPKKFSLSFNFQLFLPLLGGAILLFFVFRYTSNIQRDIDGVEEQLDKIKQKDAQIEKKLALSDNTRKLKERLDNQINAVKQLENQMVDRISLLQTLNVCLPRDSWLASVVEDTLANGGMKVTIVGEAFDSETIGSFMRKLNVSGFFNTVSLSYIEPKQSGGVETYGFEIVAQSGTNKDSLSSGKS